MSDEIEETSLIKKHKRQPIRLYVRGIFTGYKRSRKVQHPSTSLININGVSSKKDAEFYLGKRCCYVYKAKKSKKVKPTISKDGEVRDKSNYRVLWGKITRTHGNNGAVRAKFARNLPAKAMAHPVRIMLYPSNV